MTSRDGSPKENNLLPDLDDFSTEAIKRAVRNESLLHPLTLYPAAVGMLSGLAAILYDLPLLFLGMGGLLAVGATTSIVSFFFRDDVLSNRYLAKLTREFEKKRQLLLQNLQSDLQQCTTISGAEQYGRQGREQFIRVEKKYERLKTLLQKKFRTGELTYGSFLGAAEQVYLSILDNLLQIVSLLQSVETIDPVYVEARKRDLQALTEITTADEREFEALQKRLELRGDQLQQVNGLLTENEESMTVMDETVAAIAELQTGNGFGKHDLQTAMDHLREIAGRTKYFQKPEQPQANTTTHSQGDHL